MPLLELVEAVKAWMALARLGRARRSWHGLAGPGEAVMD